MCETRSGIDPRQRPFRSSIIFPNPLDLPYIEHSITTTYPDHQTIRVVSQCQLDIVRCADRVGGSDPLVCSSFELTIAVSLEG